MSGEISILQVDAFTTRPFFGNPAGVVLEGEGLSDTQMQGIAREMNVSETAFVLAPTRPDADVRVRWFTPAAEVDLCGHATVAAFHAGLEAGALAAGAHSMECRSGVLPVRAVRDAAGRPVVTMGLPVPRLEPLALPVSRISELLGLRAADVADRLPRMRTGHWLLVPVTGLEAMRRLRPDMAALRALAVEGGLGCAVVLTAETLEPGSAVHLRMFAPSFGIDEDPVTGSAQGPVAAYLHAHGLLPRSPPGGGPREAHYVAEQGDELGRSGRVEVSLSMGAGGIEAISITGRAVTVLRGTLRIPEPA